MSEPIAVIPKNSTERIQVDFTEYKGRDLLDVSVYYTDGLSEEWKPTKKGLTIRRDREIVGALRDALSEVLARLPEAEE